MVLSEVECLMMMFGVGRLVERAEINTDCVLLDVRATALSATCPCCGTSSRRTQSRYMRQGADLPIAGRRVVLRVTVRRFWCDAILCRRRIFAERFGDTVLAPLSRRTGRLETIVHHLGLALGGRPAAAFAERLTMSVSNDTLLRVVRCVLHGQRSDIFRVRQSSLEEWFPWLDGRWDQGARNASALWREMRKKGFRGQIGVVSEWARRRRLAERADQSAFARTPSARSIARLITLARDDLSKSDAVLLAAIESNVPDLVAARTLIDDFQQMIRSKAVVKLDAWLEGAKASLVGSFANESKRTSPRSATPLPLCGRMARPKARSPSSNSSSGECTAVPRLTCYRRASSAQLRLGPQ
jgi:transposase